MYVSDTIPISLIALILILILVVITLPIWVPLIFFWALGKEIKLFFMYRKSDLRSTGKG